MKVLCWMLLGSSLALAVEEPALPVWDLKEHEQLEEAGWVAGGLLLTDDPTPSPEEQTEAMLLASEPTAEVEEQSPEIPEKFLSSYFEKRPEAFLIDPQGLLSAADFRDRQNFLSYHANDSNIDLYVYVIDGDQEIPGQVREEELIERFFSEGEPAAIVFYYLGMPQRSELYLSPSITDAVSAAEQQRALASSVMQAFEKLSPPQQIESFLVQMSIRIYWMERMINGESVIGQSDMPLTNRRPKKNVEQGPSLAAFQAMAIKHAIPASAGLAVIFMAVMASYWVRRQARFRFPEFDVEPRLGGAHAAGVGAVISFASATLPPASQRDQVPDYLRRA